MIELIMFFQRQLKIKGTCNISSLGSQNILIWMTEHENFVIVYSTTISSIIVKEKSKEEY